MLGRLRAWWQQIKQHPYATGMAVFLVLILFIFLAYRFGWDWTGFNSGRGNITITSTSKGITTAKELQPAKTIWDWLSLLATLAIPIVAAIGAAWFAAQFGKASDRRNSLEQKKNQQIVENQFQQAMLQSYLDRMSELLLEKLLRNSRPDDEVRSVARARTLATLLSLDAGHKGILLQFLSESGLIETRASIINLLHADLNSTNLHGAVLSSINLSGTDLSQADLRKAY